jgi:hypothetical protein
MSHDPVLHIHAWVLVYIHTKYHLLCFMKCWHLNSGRYHGILKCERCNVILVLNYTLCHEDIWGNGGIAHAVLSSALGGGEWSTSSPRLFTPSEESTWYTWCKRLGGHRTSVNGVKRRIFCPSSESNTDSLVIRQVAVCKSVVIVTELLYILNWHVS